MALRATQSRRADSSNLGPVLADVHSLPFAGTSSHSRPGALTTERESLMPVFHYQGNWPGTSSRSPVGVAAEGTSLRITMKRWMPTAGWSFTIPLADIATLDVVTGAQVT